MLQAARCANSARTSSRFAPASALPGRCCKADEAVRLLERHPGDVADRLWLARCATLIAGRLAPSQHGAGPVGDRAFQGAAGCLVRCRVDRDQAHTRQAVERSRGFREHGIDCEPGGRAPDQAEPAAREGFAQAAIAEHSGIDPAFGSGATDPNERPRDRLGAERLEPAAAARHKRMFLRTPERLDARHADAGPARHARARTIESPLPHQGAHLLPQRLGPVLRAGLRA